MRPMRTVSLFCVLALFVGGCAQSSVDSRKPVQKPVPVAQDEVQSRRARPRSDRQVDMLREFALSEAPALWKTVQELKDEKKIREESLLRLDREMREFGRNPVEDTDYLELQASVRDLDRVIEEVMVKLEDAYIAREKFNATPGRKNYNELMRRTLEDGIREADSAANRYQKLRDAK